MLADSLQQTQRRYNCRYPTAVPTMNTAYFPTYTLGTDILENNFLYNDHDEADTTFGQIESALAAFTTIIAIPVKISFPEIH